MKNTFRFIMPRLAGATVVTGLAALVITTVFKLLLGVTVLAGAMTLIARSFDKRRKLWGQYRQDAMPSLENWNALHSSAGAGSIQPVRGYANQKGTSIVPIN